MGYVGRTFEVPAGERGLETDVSVTEQDPRALIQAEGIDQSSGSNRLEGGARLVDSGGLGASESLSADISAVVSWRAIGAAFHGDGDPAHLQTFSESRGPAEPPEFLALLENAPGVFLSNPIWTGLMLEYPASGDPSSGVLVGSIDGGVFGTRDLPVTAQADAGELVVVAVTVSAPSSGTFPPVITDSRGNVYQIDAGAGPVSLPNGRWLSSLMYSSVLDTTLQIGDTITLTRMDVLMAAAVVAYENGTNGTVRIHASSASSPAIGLRLFADLPPPGLADPVVPAIRAVTIGTGQGEAQVISVLSADYQSHHVDTAQFPGTKVSVYSRAETRSLTEIRIPVSGVTAGSTLLVGFHLTTDSASSDPSVTDSEENVYELVADTGQALTRSLLFVAHDVQEIVDGEVILRTHSNWVLAGRVTVLGTVSEFEDVGALINAQTTSSSAAPSSFVPAPLTVTEDGSLVVLIGLHRGSGATSVTPRGTATIPTNGELNEPTHPAVGTLSAWIQTDVAATPTRIVAIFDWHPVPGTQKLVSVAVEGDAFKSDSPLTDVDAVSLGQLSEAETVYFAAGGKEALGEDRKLFFFNGVDIPHVLTADGATIAPISDPPLDWNESHTGNRPTFGTIHANRLWAWGGGEQPHQIYVSSLDDHEDFTTDPLSFTVFSNIGDRLVSGAAFSQRIFLFKWPRGIFVFDTADPDVRNWIPVPISTALGCAQSPYAVVTTDTDAIFLTPDGTFHKLSSVDSLTGVLSSDTTSALRIREGLRDLMNLDRLHQVRSCWYPHRRWAMFAVPSVGSQVNDLLIKFDFSREDIRCTVSRRDTVDALTLWRDASGLDRPLIAQGDLIFELDRPERNKAGQAYGLLYQTPHLDFGSVEDEAGAGGLRTRRKVFDALELIQKPRPGGQVTIQTFLDHGEAPKQTLVFSTDYARQRRRLVGDGRTISLLVSSDSDAEIEGHMLSFRPSDEATSRPPR